jgi:hypothetical protein
MTKKELQYIAKLLTHIKPQDEHVAKALALVNKDLAHYASMKGQLRDQYEPDYSHMW